MVEDLKPVLSRITIFDKPLICPTCRHDIFTPYEMYANVEKPGIQCVFVQYCIPCERCGYVLEFNDPSRFDNEKEDYLWAFEQEWLYPPELEPYTLDELNEEDISFKTKISARILTFLVEKNKIDEKLLATFQNGQYAELTLAFDANFHVPYEHLDIRHCYIVLSFELIKHGYITPDQITYLSKLGESHDETYEQLLNAALK